jgi:branched-chain amino acid transport system ATP-binding protein
VSITAEEGAIVAIVGSNGAGKSSLIRTIAGIETPRSGAIRYRGRDIAGLPSHAVCELGVGQVAEGRQVFPTLSVRENLEMGAMLARARARMRATLHEVFGLFPRLREREGQAAGTLSGGEQQMLAIGRCLMGQPELIMFDEPSLGLAPTVVDTVFEALAEIRAGGVTILLVEQRAQFAVGFADRTHVLANGELRLTLTPADAGDTERMAAAYFAT